jgi:hypothetical protein
MMSVKFFGKMGFEFLRSALAYFLHSYIHITFSKSYADKIYRDNYGGSRKGLICYLQKSSSNK